MRKIFPVHSKRFGDRLKALMDYNNLKSLDLSARLCGYETKPKSNTSEYEECRKKKRSIDNHLKLGDLSDLSSSESLSTLYLIEYCNYFNCEADYLLGYIDFPTKQTQNIYELTGLNQKAVDALNMIKLEDENENSITVIPQELLKKNIANEEANQEDVAKLERILFDASGKYQKKIDNHRPLLMDILNFMLSSGYMEHLVVQFRNFVNAKYKVPVYYDNAKKCFVYPNNEYSYTGDIKHGKETIKGNYILNFASSTNNPNDNASIFLTDTFFDTVTLKDIEKIFYEMRSMYEEGSDV